MEQYRVNLDGLSMGDTLQCEDGIRLRIGECILAKVKCQAYVLKGINTKIIWLYHSETNNKLLEILQKINYEK